MDLDTEETQRDILEYWQDLSLATAEEDVEKKFPNLHTKLVKQGTTNS